MLSPGEGRSRSVDPLSPASVESRSLTSLGAGASGGCQGAGRGGVPAPGGSFLLLSGVNGFQGPKDAHDALTRSSRRTCARQQPTLVLVPQTAGGDVGLLLVPRSRYRYRLKRCAGSRRCHRSGGELDRPCIRSPRAGARTPRHPGDLACDANRHRQPTRHRCRRVWASEAATARAAIDVTSGRVQGVPSPALFPQGGTLSRFLTYVWICHRRRRPRLSRPTPPLT
jgi:hypothetical protein